VPPFTKPSLFSKAGLVEGRGTKLLLDKVDFSGGTSKFSLNACTVFFFFYPSSLRKLASLKGALEVTANYTLLQRRECGGVMGQLEKQETGNRTGNKNESDTITGMEY